MKTAFDFHTLDQMIRRNEGVRSRVYHDTLGIPTIGVGFNLERKDARDRLADVGVAYDDALVGKYSLTDGEIERLFRRDIDDCISDLRQMLNLDDMPLEAQCVLIDLRFNLGPTRLRTFVQTLKLFRKGAYGKAADNLAASLWARQVGKRAERSVQLLRRLGSPK